MLHLQAKALHMLAPRDKHESIDLYSRGRYGNYIQTYRTPLDATAASNGPFTIRYKGEPGVQGPFHYGITRDRLHMMWQHFAKDWDELRLYINDTIPADKIVFQGELNTGNWSHVDWLLIGSNESDIHMREAMSRPNIRRDGLAARLYLKHFMDDGSWHDLCLVIEESPEATIELVIFSTPYGSMASSGRNSIIWECRGY